jgi:glycosyltransferase involved in cell wall biosynthesis
MINHHNFIKKEPVISFFTKKKKYKPVFSILIPTWNNLDFLKLCINSLKKNSRYKHQIILHINEGNDGTLAWAKKNGFDFSYSKENIGICYALNASSSLVNSDYIVYFNDDMYACPDWDYWLFKEVELQKSDYFFLSSRISVLSCCKRVFKSCDVFLALVPALLLPLKNFDVSTDNSSVKVLIFSIVSIVLFICIYYLLKNNFFFIIVNKNYFFLIFIFLSKSL